MSLFLKISADQVVIQCGEVHFLLQQQVLLLMRRRDYVDMNPINSDPLERIRNVDKDKDGSILKKLGVMSLEPNCSFRKSYCGRKWQSNGPQL